MSQEKVGLVRWIREREAVGGGSFQRTGIEVDVHPGLDRQLVAEGGNKVGTRTTQEPEVAEAAEAAKTAFQPRRCLHCEAVRRPRSGSTSRRSLVRVQ